MQEPLSDNSSQPDGAEANSPEASHVRKGPKPRIRISEIYQRSHDTPIVYRPDEITSLSKQSVAAQAEDFRWLSDGVHAENDRELLRAFIPVAGNNLIWQPGGANLRSSKGFMQVEFFTQPRKNPDGTKTVFVARWHTKTADELVNVFPNWVVERISGRGGFDPDRRKFAEALEHQVLLDVQGLKGLQAELQRMCDQQPNFTRDHADTIDQHTASLLIGPLCFEDSEGVWVSKELANLLAEAHGCWETRQSDQPKSLGWPAEWEQWSIELARTLLPPCHFPFHPRHAAFDSISLLYHLSGSDNSLSSFAVERLRRGDLISKIESEVTEPTRAYRYRFELLGAYSQYRSFESGALLRTLAIDAAEHQSDTVRRAALTFAAASFERFASALTRVSDAKIADAAWQYVAQLRDVAEAASLPDQLPVDAAFFSGLAVLNDQQQHAQPKAQLRDVADCLSSFLQDCTAKDDPVVRERAEELLEKLTIKEFVPHYKRKRYYAAVTGLLLSCAATGIITRNWPEKSEVQERITRLADMDREDSDWDAEYQVLLKLSIENPEELLEIFESGEINEKIAALDVLPDLALQGIDVIPVVEQCIKGGNKELSLEAMRVTPELGPQTPQTLPILSIMVKNTDRELWETALGSMADIGMDCQDATAELAAALKLRARELEPQQVPRSDLLEDVTAGLAAYPFTSVQLLIPMLREKDSDMRLAALQSLMECGPLASCWRGEEDVKEICSCLHDENLKIKIASSVVLRNLKHLSAACVPELSKILERCDDYTFNGLLTVVHAIGPGAEQTIPVLFERSKTVTGDRNRFLINSLYRMQVFADDLLAQFPAEVREFQVIDQNSLAHIAARLKSTDKNTRKDFWRVILCREAAAVMLTEPDNANVKNKLSHPKSYLALLRQYISDDDIRRVASLQDTRLGNYSGLFYRECSPITLPEVAALWRDQSMYQVVMPVRFTHPETRWALPLLLRCEEGSKEEATIIEKLQSNIPDPVWIRARAEELLQSNEQNSRLAGLLCLKALGPEAIPSLPAIVATLKSQDRPQYLAAADCLMTAGISHLPESDRERLVDFILEYPGRILQSPEVASALQDSGVQLSFGAEEFAKLYSRLWPPDHQIDGDAKDAAKLTNVSDFHEIEKRRQSFFKTQLRYLRPMEGPDIEALCGLLQNPEYSQGAAMTLAVTDIPQENILPQMHAALGSEQYGVRLAALRYIMHQTEDSPQQQKLIAEQVRKTLDQVLTASESLIAAQGTQQARFSYGNWISLFVGESSQFWHSLAAAQSLEDPPRALGLICELNILQREMIRLSNSETLPLDDSLKTYLDQKMVRIFKTLGDTVVPQICSSLDGLKPEAQEFLLAVLSEIDADTAQSEEVVLALARNSSSSLRSSSIRTLCQASHDSTAISGFLHELLDDRDKEIRTMAAVKLTEFHSEQAAALPVLLERLKQHPDDQTILQIVPAIGRCGASNSEVVPVLLEGLALQEKRHSMLRRFRIPGDSETNAQRRKRQIHCWKACMAYYSAFEQLGAEAEAAGDVLLCLIQGDWQLGVEMKSSPGMHTFANHDYLEVENLETLRAARVKAFIAVSTDLRAAVPYLTSYITEYYPAQQEVEALRERAKVDGQFRDELKKMAARLHGWPLTRLRQVLDQIEVEPPPAWTDIEDGYMIFDL